MTKGFLPITYEEMNALGWERPDFVYVCGDAYVDHPSFGAAIITRLLEGSERISFLPEFATAEYVAAGKLAYLNVIDFNAHIWKQLIYHKTKWMSEALKAFIEYVTENEFC